MSCFDVTYIKLTIGNLKSVLTLQSLFCRTVLLGVILQHCSPRKHGEWLVICFLWLILETHSNNKPKFPPTVICTWRWPHFPPLQSFPPSSPDCLPPISSLQNPVVISALFHYPFCWKAAVAWLMNDDSEQSNKNTWCKWAVSSVILWCLIIVTSWHFPLKLSSCNFISL